MSRPSLPGALLQRLAARLCAPEAAERVLLPIVADMQFEWQQASSARRRMLVRLRGGWAFARALVPTLARFSPEERDLTGRLLGRTVLATLAVGAVMFADGVKWPASRGLSNVYLLLVPSVLCVAIPIGCLFGVLLSAGHPRWRPSLAIATLAGLITFGVAGWLTPHANQLYRKRILTALGKARGVPLERGDREYTFGELGLRITELRASGDPRAADRFAVEWHKKPVLAVFCVVLTLGGLAAWTRASRMGWRLALGLLLVYGSYVLLRLGEQLGDAGRLAPALAMWGPVIAMAAVTPLVARRR
jgi:hypothetical protein